MVCVQAYGVTVAPTLLYDTWAIRKNEYYDLNVREKRAIHHYSRTHASKQNYNATPYMGLLRRT